MISRKTFIAVLLAGTMLSGCNGNDGKSAGDGGTQGTFVTKDEFGKTASGLDDANQRIGSLESALDDANKLIAGQDNIIKSLKLTAMQPDVSALQGELSGRQGHIQTLADLGSKILAFEAKTAAFTAENPAEEGAALPSQDTDFKVLKEDIARALADGGPDLAKGLKLIEALTNLPAGATAKDVEALNSQIQAVTDALQSRDSALAGEIEVLLKRYAELETKTKAATGQNLADYVNTTRGSAYGESISTGNNFPATALPFGFNMWSPVNTTDENVFYEATEGKNMRAFAVTHEASKWNGNHQSLKFMPVRDETVRLPNDAGESFKRSNEMAKPHYYSVTFDNGMKTEITPTDHAAYVRFSAADTSNKITIAFDTFADNGSLKFNAAEGTASGHSEHRANSYTPKMYFFIRFDNRIANFRENISSGDVRSWAQFDTPAGRKVVGMRIATSFISIEQAKDNLDQEIAGKSFEEIRSAAEDTWLARLNTITVKGATENQKTILYSNMYRAFLYPNSAWENVNTDGKYVATYATPYAEAPFTSSSPAPTPKEKIKRGKIWVNNGFWDTYRTTWPLYTLLMPREAGAMIDGFVNGFKDGGWTTRWSNPGYADSMVATSSDVIFADAYLKGVRNFDIDAAYKSMLRNATAYSDRNDRGRKGMDQMPFYGYKPGDGESVSWSLEAYLNDFGISEMAKALGKTDDAAYLANRAISYPLIFDGTSTGAWAGGWFRTKNTDGSWRSGPSTPQSWGYGYTEGNAWSYAFLAPQDGQGLANLYGGRDRLKAKLDKFFTTTPKLERGGYQYIIHEIREAAKVDELAHVGEYQHSNQTVHHSIYMYNYAGSPSSGQKYLRDVMDNLYFTGFDANGISNGEGYIGDEDNGEQSAWYILSAMGFYPVSMGRPEYAIGAPYFKQMSVRLKDNEGKTRLLTIKAPNVSSDNRFVQAVRLNSNPVTRNYLLHSEVAAGGTLEFDMGPNPSQWGTGTDDVPTSITQGTARPSPLVSLLPQSQYDMTASTPANLTRVVDRNSGTEWSSPAGATTWIEADLKAGSTTSVVKLYTLTSAAGEGQDPTSWTLKGTNDGTRWVTLDERKDETFPWRRQTRPFAIKTPAAFSKYRLELGDGAVTIAEFELLGE